MKRFLTEDEQKKLGQRIKDAEKRTGAQFVLAVIEKSDAYPEAPWRAFALGVSIAALAVFVKSLLDSSWPSFFILFMSVALILGTGAVLALLSVLFPRMARVFLTRDRTATEVQQYAESLFLEHELFATKDRCGILVLISLFEQRVVLLPDTGLRDRLNDKVLSECIKLITERFKPGAAYEALDSGLQQLIDVLGSIPPDQRDNELPDDILQQERSK